jgi:hypothetical protein
MKKLFKSDWLLLLSGDDAMASYFDEHDCQPLGQGEGPDHMMHMARLLIDSGAWNESEFSAMFSDRVPPPTSKKFLDDLKDHLVRNEGNFLTCGFWDLFLDQKNQFGTNFWNGL